MRRKNASIKSERNCSKKNSVPCNTTLTREYKRPASKIKLYHFSFKRTNMKTQALILVFCAIICGVTPRVMQDRFWVESRSPIVRERNYRHREVMVEPIMDRKIHKMPKTTHTYDESVR